MPTDEQVEAAKKLIARDSDRAAYTLAEAQVRCQELESAMSAVRAFSQNPWLAQRASRKQIESVLGRELMDVPASTVSGVSFAQVYVK